MFDIENVVFDHVYEAIHDMLPPGCMASEYVHEASKFPFVTLIEITNNTVDSLQDNRLRENYALITFDANVYAKSKDECRQIIAALDAAMLEMQFSRVSPGIQYLQLIGAQYLQVMQDPFVVRVQARYEAVTDGQQIYRK